MRVSVEGGGAVRLLHLETPAKERFKDLAYLKQGDPLGRPYNISMDCLVLSGRFCAAAFLIYWQCRFQLRQHRRDACATKPSIGRPSGSPLHYTFLFDLAGEGVAVGRTSPA